MSVFIVGQGECVSGGLESLASDPDFRRSTENMAYAYLAMQSCMKNCGVELGKISSEVGLILGTSHGELGATVGFLEEIAKTGTARPLLFQASLHNATLGFLTKKFLITGPAFTVSDSLFSGEESLELAMTLIETGILKYAFVIGVDIKVPKIEKPLLSMYKSPLQLGSGAGCLLLSSEDGLSLFSKAQARQVLGLEINRKSGSSSLNFENENSYYDSNFVERVARESFNTETLTSVKPDQSFSVLRLKSA